MATQSDQLRDYFEGNAATFGMDRQALRIEPILNHGGFVNASFRIDDGRASFHLKLARNPADLATFWTHSRLLTDRYRSPRALAWVDIPPLGSGIVFEGLAAHPASEVSLSPARELARLLGALHTDMDLARRLSAGRHPCAQTYHVTFGRRFTADLDMITQHRPPFVSEATVAFLGKEVRALGEIVDRHSAFTATANAPIHSDIWANNVLVEQPGLEQQGLETRGRWWLIDWDDLDIGDPALDIAMLLEFAGRIDGPLVEPDALGIDLADAARARTLVYRRASRLDWVVDSLADWLDAGEHAAWTGQVRRQKEADYAHALKRYRATYTQPPQTNLEDR